MARTPWDITREMFLSIEEVDQLLAYIRTETEETGISADLNRVIIEVLLFTGLRNSEFCRLRLADALLEGGEPGLMVAGTEGPRMVYVAEETRQLLAHYVEQVRPQLLPPNEKPDDPDRPLIVHERGRPFERTGLYRRVVRILENAGLGERASVQLLRHTYGYLAYLRTGGNLLFVQRQLGHAHPMITSIYAQFVDESYSGLANQVEASTLAVATASRRPQPAPPRTYAVEEFQSEFD